MDLLPQFFPQLLPDLLSQKGEIMGLDQISFNDFFLSPDAGKLAVALTPSWVEQDFRELDGWSNTIGIDPEELLLVLTSESRLRTDAMNPKSGMPLACGLNQMTRIAFQAIGKLPSASPPGSAAAKAADDKAKGLFPALAHATVKMNVKEQFQSVLMPYFAKCKESFSGDWTAAKLYMGNASPSKLSVSTDPATVIYAKGSPEFAANAQLDTNGDGQITMQDLINAVNYHRETPEYVAAKYRYRKVNNMVPFSNPSLPTGWPT